MRVLFVEDESDARLLVGQGLQLSGFSVDVVEDGPAALRALNAGAYDAIVTDMVMPNGVTGAEVAELARRLQPTAQIVVVSGYALGQLPALPDGVQFLRKPYRFRELVALLRCFTR